MKISEKIKKSHNLYKIAVWCSIVYYDFIMDSISYIKILLRRAGILHEDKFERIKNLRKKYDGKRCFIIATGPSLTMSDLSKLKDEYTIGVNSLVKILDEMDYVPTFYGIQDGNVFDKLSDIIEQSKLRNVFITDSLYSKLNRKSAKDFFQYSLYNKGHLAHNDLRPLSSGFSNDVSVCVYDGYSVTYSMLQIAVYMGFTEIYLLGCDCTYNTSGGKQHFIESGHFDKNAASVGEKMIYAYTVAKKHLDKYYPNVKIYNATRGGMLEVFQRKNIDEIFGK